MKRLGPVLQFLGCDQGQWRVSVLWVQDGTDAAPVLSAGGRPVQAMQAPVPGSRCTAWRFEFAVAQTAVAQDVAYSIGGESHGLCVPARDALPALAYASCNGFSDPTLMKKVREPNALWARLGRLHAVQDRVDSQSYGPLHLLLLGGDQVYSDAMWAVIPELKAWCALPRDKRWKAAFTATLRRKVEAYFSSLYLERWSQPEVAAMLARLPTVMMWDDHDIMDGWGSYPQEQHACPVYQGIFDVARRAFALFQRQALGALPPATLPGQDHHNSACRVGALGLLVLDTRSERRPRSLQTDANGDVLQAEQVLSARSWTAVYQWLAAQEAAGGLKHLFVMSSVPVVHPGLELIEKVLGVLPGQQDMEDDLRDHWSSPAHKPERLRLIHRLLQVAGRGVRVTILSGDVHVAALGVIESTRDEGRGGNARVINQLTSSAIVHPTSSALEVFVLEHVARHEEQVDRGITSRMLDFPTTGRCVMARRNFLTLQPDAPGGEDRYWANWWTEGEPHPYTKVVHAIGAPG
ncbi:MAG: alkaline phosphatase D family protein [Hylemonella sp.]|nr:alkaline phosphatase D family protein [Hylemonella sp.]